MSSKGKRRAAVSEVGNDVYEYFLARHTRPGDFENEDGEIEHAAALTALLVGLGAMMRVSGAGDEEVSAFFEQFIEIEADVAEDNRKFLAEQAAIVEAAQCIDKTVH